MCSIPPKRSRHQNPDMPQDTNKLSRSSVEVRADIIAQGGKLEQDGVLEDSKSTGIHLNVPEGASDQDIHHLQQSSEKILSGISRINASIIGPNAVVGGRIKNAEATGALFTISGRKKKTNSRER